MLPLVPRSGRGLALQHQCLAATLRQLQLQLLHLAAIRVVTQGILLLLPLLFLAVAVTRATRATLLGTTEKKSKCRENGSSK